MALLILIALAQLGVSVLILLYLMDLNLSGSTPPDPEAEIRRLRDQVIGSMFDAEAAATQKRSATRSDDS